jgi:hypothetical protein
VGLTTTAVVGQYTVALTTSDLSVGTYNSWATGTYNGANIFSTSPELFEVLSPSNEMYYATVVDLRNYLNLSNTSEDARLFEYIVSASGYIDNYCCRKFRQYTGTYNRYHEDPQQIMLGDYPILSISGITVTTIGTNPDTDSVSSDDYYVDYDIGRIRFFTNYTGKFSVSYVAGMTSLPAPIRLACLKLGSFYYNKRRREGIKHESLLSYSYTLSPDLKEELAALLDPYRLVTL